MDALDRIKRARDEFEEGERNSVNYRNSEANRQSVLTRYLNRVDRILDTPEPSDSEAGRG